MKIKLRNSMNLGALFEEQGVAELDFVDMCIGFDGKAYCLFSSHIPERVNGMFVNTVTNATYTALAITPSWESGAVEKVERIDFGRHAMNFHFLRPVPDGSFLLLGARCVFDRTSGPEKNAVFTDRAGNVLRALTFGDGIANCIVREDGIIITSYFDEGVFGNYGWDEPIGRAGLCAWTTDGGIIWRHDRDIADCYAMNTDAGGNLWYYYYTDFLLIRTDFRTEAEYDPQVNGANSFAVAGNSKYLIMSDGYEDNRSFHVHRFSGDRIEGAEPLAFVNEDGAAVSAFPGVVYGAKALVLIENKDISFVDFTNIE